MANQLKMAIVQSILSLQAQGWAQRVIARRLERHFEGVGAVVVVADREVAELAHEFAGAPAASAKADAALGERRSESADPHLPTRLSNSLSRFSMGAGAKTLSNTLHPADALSSG